MILDLILFRCLCSFFLWVFRRFVRSDWDNFGIFDWFLIELSWDSFLVNDFNVLFMIYKMLWILLNFIFIVLLWWFIFFFGVICCFGVFFDFFIGVDLLDCEIIVLFVNLWIVLSLVFRLGIIFNLVFELFIVLDCLFLLFELFCLLIKLRFCGFVCFLIIFFINMFSFEK